MTQPNPAPALPTERVTEHPFGLTRLREGRPLSITPFTIRTALEDVELIKASETVTVSISAANLDPLHRDGGHVAFGHGIHQCLGRQPARAELQIPALVSRRLAVYGVHELPVARDA
ncbi:hypothetical protein ACFWYW_19125 [Nonomuraea sp. NPDC059023]|uniref:hypothetical protein n=1 Tax=unclassified Nonomuraea TaxID=2593643 RepID=UPI0036AF2C68